jgi:hypothetical protein
MPSTDKVVDLAKRAEARLSSPDRDGPVESFEAIDAGLRDALEAARLFRVELDLGGQLSVNRLLALEATLRSTVGVQPQLTELVLEGTLAVASEVEAEDERTVRARELRERSLLATQAILESLRAGYQLMIGSEVRS